MTLRIGLLAASRIAEAAVVEPAAVVDGVEVVAVAARSADRAAEAAHRWGIARAYGAYGDLLTDPAVDAVYVSSPAALHPEHAIAALGAGKHVLVEKPIAANAADARHLAEAAHRSPLVVMEAAHWRYHPIVDLMAAALAPLGRVRRATARFDVSAAIIPPTDIRHDLRLGGGAMMDLGVYPVMWLAWLLGEPPHVLSASAVEGAAGIDVSMTVVVAGPDGFEGRIETSMDRTDIEAARMLDVDCERGRMTVENPLAPQHGASITVDTPDGTVRVDVPTTTTYQHQMEAFRDAVVDGSPFPTTVDAAVSTMEVVDAAYRAAGLRPRPSRVTRS